MKKNKKLIILVSCIIVVILVSILIAHNIPKKYGENSVIDNKGIMHNNSQKLKEIKTYQHYSISNIQINGTEEKNTLSCIVKNNSEDLADNMNVYLELLDNNGNIIDTIFGYIPTISPQEEKSLTITIGTNIVDIYDVKCYVIKAN